MSGGVRLSAVPPCFGALGRCDCAGFRLTLAPRSWRQGGGAGVYSGSFRLQASADVRRSESYYRLVIEVTTVFGRLPSGQAQCVPAEDRHDSPRRQSRRLPPPAAGGQECVPEVDKRIY